MGLPGGIDASLLAASVWTRPCNLLGAIRGHAGRCDGIADLFQRGVVHSSRHVIVIG